MYDYNHNTLPQPFDHYIPKQKLALRDNITYYVQRRQEHTFTLSYLDIILYNSKSQIQT